MKIIICIDIGKWWEMIACVDVHFFYIDKCYEIIICVDVGKW